MKKTITKDFVTKHLTDSSKAKNDTALHLSSEIFKASQLIIQTFKKSGKVYIIGNGGSAADAQHIAADFVGRFRIDKPLPAIALTTDTSILTALANDFGSDQIFNRQIEAFGSPKDILLAISTSGKSKNIINGINTARQKRMKVIVLTSSQDKTMGKLADVAIPVPATDIAYIQETHISIGHIFCSLAKEYFNK